MAQFGEHAWVLIERITGPKQTWNYMVMREDPRSDRFGHLVSSERIGSDSPLRPFSYERLRNDLASRGFSQAEIPPPEYFEPQPTEQESGRDEIVRKVPPEQ